MSMEHPLYAHLESISSVYLCLIHVSFALISPAIVSSNLIFPLSPPSFTHSTSTLSYTPSYTFSYAFPYALS
ncbi:hypothetical protein HYPBUDRAFT_151410, partial [Hyphopichia burtonii NRRL Y-1933]